MSVLFKKKPQDFIVEFTRLDSPMGQNSYLNVSIMKLKPKKKIRENKNVWFSIFKARNQISHCNSLHYGVLKTHLKSAFLVAAIPVSGVYWLLY